MNYFELFEDHYIMLSKQTTSWKLLLRLIIKRVPTPLWGNIMDLIHKTIELSTWQKIELVGVLYNYSKA